MARYKKLKCQQDGTPAVRKDPQGNINRVAVGGKVFRFDREKKQWTIEQQQAQIEKVKGSSTRQKLVTHATRAELIFRGLLRHLGIKHEFQKQIKTGNGNRYADFLIPSLKLIIEIDGGYHDNPEQQALDRQREREIMDATRYEIIRFSNSQVENDPDILFDTLVQRLKTHFNHIKAHWTVHKMEVVGG